MSSSNTDALRVYLEDHWAGAGAGLSLARRIAEHNDDAAWDDRLSALADEIDADETTLSGLRESLGVDTGWVSLGGLKRVVGEVGERVARLKTHWPMLPDTAANRVLEVEAMMSGIAGKRSLWRALRDSGHDEGVGVDLDQMIARADAQIDTMERFHRDVARRTFAGADD